jgi:hypothetical protein
VGDEDSDGETDIVAVDDKDGETVDDDDAVDESDGVVDTRMQSVCPVLPLVK